MEYLPDTNVFSRIFQSNFVIRQFVETRNCAIDTTIYIECLQGSKSNYEKRLIEKYLLRFPVIPMTPTTSNLAVDLIRTYSNSHGLLLADAQIAATALENDLTVLTYNIADFQFIKDLKCEKPPI